MPDPYEPVSYLESIATWFSINAIQGFAGASAGIASSMVTCPLDVIKVRLQGREGLQSWTLDLVSKHRAFQDRGLIGTGRLIWHEDGLRGMYRGLGPTMLAYLPRWSVYFPVYHKSNEILNKEFGLSKSWISPFISATSAGVSAVIVTNPLWVIKTRLMSQHRVYSNLSQPQIYGYYKSTLDCARKIYSTEGIRSFYSGLTPALLGVSHLAIQFPLYEQLKRTLTGTGLGGSDEAGTLQILEILTASSLSKICAGAATYPHEVIRTRLQTQRITHPPASLGRNPAHASPYAGLREGASSDGAEMRGTLPVRYRGIVNTTRTILREEGWRAMYAGMGTSMIRAIPASATTMLVYETTVQFLKKSRADGTRKLKLLGGPEDAGQV